MKTLALLALCLASVVTALALDDAPIHSPIAPYPAVGEVVRMDPDFDALLAPEARPELLATGFDWSEGPVWDFQSERLYFSDVPRNIVYQWQPDEGVSIFLSPSGFTGEDYEGYEPGSNGLAFDAQGQLVLCQHGDRRVARLNDKRWGFTTLADSYQGERLNSPNDLCFDARGNLFFTDPPYGRSRETQRNVEISSVYRLSSDGKLSRLAINLKRPNGIGISPDQKTLYVTSTAREEPFIYAYPLRDDGSVGGEGSIFFDARDYLGPDRPGLCDGLAVDLQGNVWTSGPGGVYAIAPDGRVLGAVLVGRSANCAFGGSDGQTLFITADDKLVRLRTQASGYFPHRSSITNDSP